MNSSLELLFVKYKVKFFLEAYLKLVEKGITRIRLRPFNMFASEFLKQAAKHNNKSVFYVDETEAEILLPPNIFLLKNDESVDAVIIFTSDAKLLSSMLMDYIDTEKGIIIALITERYYKNKPLFLISIPKSGTHMLYGLAQTFGYLFGGNCPDNPLSGNWYFIDSMNSHTSTSFLDFRNSSWNVYHPFVRNAAIFIYRNPLDILVSEANYYHKDGKTAFYSYLSNLAFDERLLRLIDDPWLLGSIRDRIGNFIAWLDMQNVIPISFEELIGPNGGGSKEVQTKLIWSLQLKLHVPGNPEEFGNKIFNKGSATFHEGQIGAYRKYFTEKAYEKFYSLPQDFMNMLGYDFADMDNPQKIPKRADEFRKRPLAFSEADFDDTPIGMEYNYLGHNIVRFKGLFYGVPQSLGELDFTNPKNLCSRKLKIAETIEAVKQKIILK